MDGQVIMYADKDDRGDARGDGRDRPPRAVQIAYNEEHGITPETICQGCLDIVDAARLHRRVAPAAPRKAAGRGRRARRRRGSSELERMIIEREQEMFAAAEDLRLRAGAARLRDEIG